MTTRTVTPTDLDMLSRAAATHSRRRQNLNLHSDSSDYCQRMYHAVEPGSYVRPHRHINPSRPECFVAVRGRFLLVLFDDFGNRTAWFELSPAGPAVAVDLAPGAWHTVIAREPGSVFFETKPGPYDPLTDKDFAPWAPPEGSAAAPCFLAQLHELFPD